MNSVKLSALISAGITLAFHVWFIRDAMRHSSKQDSIGEILDVAVVMFAALFVVVWVIVCVVTWAIGREPGAWNDWSIGSFNVNLAVTVITLVSVVRLLAGYQVFAILLLVPAPYVVVLIFDDGK